MEIIVMIAPAKRLIKSVSDLYTYIQDCGRSSELQRYCEDIVRKEVYVNQSMLVQKLLEDMTFHDEDITNFYSYLDGADNVYDSEEQYKKAKEVCKQELEELDGQLDEAQDDVSVGYVDGDYLTEDYKHFYQYGKLVLTIEFDEQAADEHADDEKYPTEAMWQQIRAHMEAAKFFVDVYFQDERGFQEIMLQEPSAEREFEQAQTSAAQKVSDLEDAIERKKAELENVFDDKEYPRLESKEIFEWWVVSFYLLGRLKNWNEAHIENDLGAWWGRTATGQSISIDSVIENIACEEMLRSHYKLNDVLTPEQIAALDLPQRWERE